MFLKKYLFSTAAVVTIMVSLNFNSLHAAVTEEDIAAMKNAMLPQTMECIEEFKLTKDDLIAMKNKRSNDIDPCFLACIFKKTGVFTDKGTFDLNKALELTKPYIKDEKDWEIIHEIKKDCSKVNDEAVSDGERGCERSTLLVKCFDDHKDMIKLF